MPERAESELSAPDSLRTERLQVRGGAGWSLQEVHRQGGRGRGGEGAYQVPMARLRRRRGAVYRRRSLTPRRYRMIHEAKKVR